jgi:16S rRNA (cytidine1402-2'-O)-methyltransferase
MNKGIGKLFLIPNTLGDISPNKVMSLSIRDVIHSTHHFVFEKEKIGRAYIKQWCPKKSQNELVIQTLNKHTSQQELLQMLNPCLSGHNMALITDAGCPGVADPGADLVLLAHQSKVSVHPFVGPSSILLALMGSGLNGQQFAFNGYLPIDKQSCKQAIKNFERISSSNNQTQIFIETPYRNSRCFELLIDFLSANTLLCVACDLSLPTELIQTKTVAEWKKIELDLHKRPSIFLFLHPSA